MSGNVTALSDIKITLTVTGVHADRIVRADHSLSLAEYNLHLAPGQKGHVLQYEIEKLLLALIEATE